MLVEKTLIDGLQALARVAARRLSRGVVASERERGDVPGWVLITLMTAGLVLLLWALAGPALTGVFTSAITNVQSGIGG